MTIDELIAHGERVLPIFGGEHGEYVKATLELLKLQKEAERLTNWEKIDGIEEDE